MTVTSAEIDLVRKYANDPELTGLYSDNEIQSVIEAHPLGTDPETYDLKHAAADIWDMKAAKFAEQVSFSADGASFQLSNKFKQAQEMSRYYRSRRKTRDVTVVSGPFNTPGFVVGNPPVGVLSGSTSDDRTN